MSATDPTQPIAREDFRLDGILRLIEEAGKSGPLGQILGTLCAQISIIAHADVVSIYVVEGEGLVMQANVGFEVSAPGTVRLGRSQGIVGAAVKAMRPISASVAREDPHYLHVPDLGEERYPSFLAIPLMRSAEVAGVLVLQRGETIAFTDTEVALATALATTIAHALERAGSGPEAAPRSARLTGLRGTTGAAMGRAMLLGTLESIQAQGDAVPEPGKQVGNAFEAVATVLRKGQRRAEKVVSATDRRRLQSHALMLEDQRLRNTVAGRCEALGVVSGLRQVAREYAGATYMTGESNPLLADRAAEIEHLCLLVAATACDLPYATPGSLLVVPERLTATLALAVIGWRSEGAVVAARQPPDCLGLALLQATELPALCDVAGLFAWIRQGDTVILDADEAVLRINPPATMIARYRRDR